MTDSPKNPSDSRRRKDRGREPSTIDLKATVVGEPAPVGTEPVGSEPDATVKAHGDPLRSALGPEAAASGAPQAGPETGAGPGEPGDKPAGETFPETAPAADAAAVREERASEPAAPQRPARRGGVGALLGAGLLGGLIGAGGFFAAETWWRPQPARTLDSRLANLEARAGMLAPAEALKSLDQRVAALGGDVTSLREQVRALAERPTPPADAPSPGQPAPSAAASAPAPAPDSTVLNDLSARLAALETQLREQASSSAAAMDALGGRIRTEVGHEVQQEVRAMRSALDAAAQAAQKAEANAGALQGLERRVADQDQRLAALTRQMSDQGPQSAAAASLKVVVSDQVARAVRDGAPYADALAALQRLGVEPARLQPLEPFAGTGAPTATALARDFQPLGERIVQDNRPAPASWSDRLWRMVDRVVTVRAVGERDANSPSGLVARIGTALARGALKDAAGAWDALPEPARRASEAWGQRLKQRIAAEEAAQKLSAEALTALEASTRSRS